jgi:putative transposase
LTLPPKNRSIMSRAAKFGGLEVTEAKRLRTLEEENAKLKKLLAEAMLDIAVFKDISSKNGDARREA